MDGDSEWGILTRVILPNIKASVASLGILLFINSWNDYMWPMLITSKLENARYRLACGLLSAQIPICGGFDGGHYNFMYSHSAALSFMQRQIVDSFVKWGIK